MDMDYAAFMFRKATLFCQGKLPIVEAAGYKWIRLILAHKRVE